MNTQLKTPLNTSKHSKVRRGAQRASYDKEQVFSLINELRLGHLGFSVEGRPVIIPMTLWALNGYLYFHVANKSRLQKLLEAGGEMCVSFAECEEWVMAKSAYHHSANYRSAVLYCTGSRVTGPDEFDDVFKQLINSMEADRWDSVRPPSAQERKGTALMRLTINEGSYKSRAGGPTVDEADSDWPVWHGTLARCPLRT